MTTPTIIALTTQGVIRQEYNTDSIIDRFLTNINSGCTGSVGTDSKDQSMWIGDESQSSIAKIKLSNDSVITLPVNGISSIVSVQEDHSTGNVFILTRKYPYLSTTISSSSSSSSSSSISSGEKLGSDPTTTRGWIVKYDSSLLTSSIFNPTELGSEIPLIGPFDCKLDHIRRVMWVTECGNNDVLGISIDTGEVLKRYSATTMVFPTVLAVSPTTGDIFVRAWSSLDSRELIYRFGENGFVCSFRGSSTPTQGDVHQGILNGSISTPSVDSIKYDQVRDKLWWVSGPEDNKIYMLDAIRLTGRAMTLFPDTPSSSSSYSSSSSSSSKSSSSSSSSSNSSSSNSSSSISSSTMLMTSSSSSSISETSASSNSSSSFDDYYVASGFSVAVNGTYTQNGDMYDGEKVYTVGGVAPNSGVLVLFKTVWIWRLGLMASSNYGSGYFLLVSATVSGGTPETSIWEGQPTGVVTKYSI